MLAHAPAAAALSVLRERVAHPAADDPGSGAGRLPAGAWDGSGARAHAPLLANAVAAAPSSHQASSQGPQVPASRDSLDLSALAQRLLDGLGGSSADGGSAIDDLLGGEVGGYLDAALERMTAEIENLFRLLGMSAVDAAAAAAGIGAPAAAQARAGMLTFHAESSAMSASSLVTATGSRQSLSLVMQSIDIAINPANGTVTISQQSLSVAIEVRTGDQVQVDPLILDLAGDNLDSAAVMNRLLGLDGKLSADDRQSRLDDHGIVRLRLGAVVPLGIDLVGGRLVTAGRFDHADGGIGRIADALLDLNA